jgi:hypothetical protein
MIFVLRQQVAVDGRNLPIRYAIAAKFFIDELDLAGLGFSG